MRRELERARASASKGIGFCCVVSAIAVAGCGEPPGDMDGIGSQGPVPLAKGAEQKRRLCSRGRSDIVLDAFCRDEPPEIESLLDLREALHIDASPYRQDFAVTAHSTALAARSVSAINPRVLFIDEPTPTGTIELTVLAFARGEQLVEAVVRDRVGGELQFYLITFEQACNEVGCTPGDLLTEAAEVGWKNLNVYAEEDVANTPLDCGVCHQPNGPGTPKLLRMQELAAPWNHWLYPFVPGGRAVIADYVAAKDGELLGGLSASDIAARSNPGALAATIHFANPEPQSNLFVSALIEQEVNASAASRGGDQPVDNSVPGESATWDEIYARAKRGEAISVPYHDVKVTDPDKLAAMTAAYRDYLDGVLPREQLPDIRDVFPDDQRLLARMGFAVEPDMSGEEILLQACGQCHNDRLNQRLSRARFNVDLSRMSREQKDRAISRVLLPVEHGSVMPPKLFRHLTQEDRRKLVELLER